MCNATDTVDKPGTTDWLRYELRLQDSTLLPCCDLSCLLEAPQDLAGEEQEQWQDGLQQLKDLGLDDGLAEKSLKRGFGWSSQAYWWKDKVNEVPKPGEVHKSATQWLSIQEAQRVPCYRCFSVTMLKLLWSFMV